MEPREATAAAERGCASTDLGPGERGHRRQVHGDALAGEDLQLVQPTLDHVQHDADVTVRASR